MITKTSCIGSSVASTSSIPTPTVDITAKAKDLKVAWTVAPFSIAITLEGTARTNPALSFTINADSETAHEVTIKGPASLASIGAQVVKAFNDAGFITQGAMAGGVFGIQAVWTGATRSGPHMQRGRN
jgi:hypothetical protein